MNIQRIWAMPNKLTFTIKPIKDLLKREITSGLWVDPFANNSTLKRMICWVNIIDNDLNTEYKTDFHLDALDFLKQFDCESVDGVVYDPPYSFRQVAECYKGFGKEVTQSDTRMTLWSNTKDEIARIVKPHGKVICFGWTSQGIGKNRGFEMEKILLVPHGGSRNDTIVTVERKLLKDIQIRLEIGD